MTEAGRRELQRDPNSEGSLGLAISGGGRGGGLARRHHLRTGFRTQPTCCCRPSSAWRRKRQFEKIGLYPDVILGPCGGGSSFGGIAFPFLADRAAGDKRAQRLRCVAVRADLLPDADQGALRLRFRRRLRLPRR